MGYALRLETPKRAHASTWLTGYRTGGAQYLEVPGANARVRRHNKRYWKLFLETRVPILQSAGVKANSERKGRK